MNPVRRRRLLWVLLFAAAAAVAVGLVVLALQRNVAYLYTPSEVLGGAAGESVASGLAFPPRRHGREAASAARQARCNRASR
jgi:cytochrome c-type biogenesis protein CcmE